MAVDNDDAAAMAASDITEAVSELHITAADPTPPSTSTPVAESCRFLEKIPAELRNEIYQLAFNPDHDAEKKVNLFQASPPQKSILSTCHQIYEEAREYYVEAYRSYWQETEFSVICEMPRDPYDFETDENDEGFPYQEEDDLKAAEEVELVTFRARDVDHIRKIRVYRQVLFCDDTYGFKRFKFQDGVWFGKLRERKQTLEFRFSKSESRRIEVFNEDWKKIPASLRKSHERRLPFHLQLTCLIWCMGTWDSLWDAIGVGALPVWGRLGCTE